MKMNRLTALFLSAGITGFLLVSVTGIIANATAVAASSPAQDFVAEPAVTPLPVTTDQETAVQRESEYRKLIDEANQRIQEANVQIEKLKAQVQQAQSAATAQVSSNSQYQVSPDVAAQFVLSVAPGA